MISFTETLTEYNIPFEVLDNTQAVPILHTNVDIGNIFNAAWNGNWHTTDT